MAHESFDKEVQFLRLLSLAGGAYNRQQFASRLGISVHTYDKTARRFKEMQHTLRQHLTAEQERELLEQLQLTTYESADPLLLLLFRAKSLKASESARLAAIMIQLQQQSLTAAQLLDCCTAVTPVEAALPDEKTIRADLKYLEMVGCIVREGMKRPYRYKAANILLQALSDEELLDLHDFVDVMANSQIPSVQGYLLRDTLRKALRRQLATEALEIHQYKYHYRSRILDEAHLYTITQAIQEQKKLRFLYLSPKRGKNYASKNTNPRFERETEGTVELTVPVRVVYDHQYGRWYLIGYKAGKGTVKYRMEGMTDIEQQDAVDNEQFALYAERVSRQMEQSWVTDTSRAVKVVARFYNPDRPGANFIRERVEAQGQWGTIREESATSFLYEITINGVNELKPWLRSFGSSCEVLEPAALRREFIAEWRELQARYESVRKNI